MAVLPLQFILNNFSTWGVLLSSHSLMSKSLTQFSKTQSSVSSLIRTVFTAQPLRDMTTSSSFTLPPVLLHSNGLPVCVTFASLLYLPFSTPLYLTHAQNYRFSITSCVGLCSPTHQYNDPCPYVIFDTNMPQPDELPRSFGKLNNQ